MGLASESEWETDPALKAMRRDFVASFEARWQLIERALPELRGDKTGEKYSAALARVVAVAHKLAGAGETYGFPTLTRACAAFEDWFDRCESGHDQRLACSGVEYLVAVLKSCAQAGRDVPAQAQDPVLKALESAG